MGLTSRRDRVIMLVLQINRELRSCRYTMSSMAALNFWLAYLLTALLAVSVCWHSGWHPAIKAVAIVLALTLYASHYLFLPRLAGWPSDARLPDNFRLLAANIEEPDKSRGRNGTIFLWTMSLDDNPVPKPPRAYRLPYSVTLHEQLNVALTKLRRGLPQLGQTRLHKAGSNTGTTVAAFATLRMDLEFFDVPDPLFPRG
jgi:hypothetical protein